MINNLNSIHKYSKQIKYLSIIIVGFLVYGNVISGKFLFDDNLLIEQNSLIKSLDNFWTFFVSSSTEGVGLSDSNFYRPLQHVVYSVLYYFFELNPAPYHIFSIFLHIINSMLVFSILKKINFSSAVSFFLTLFFLVHPINTQAISYISGVADPLGFLFGFLLIHSLFMLKEKGLINIFKIFLFFVLALLSKESTVIFFPLSVLLTVYFWNDLSCKKRKIYVSTLLGMLVFSTSYIILKFTIFDFTDNIGLTAQSNIYTENLYIRLITFISIMPEYLKMIFFPIEMSYEKPYVACISMITSKFLIGFLIVLIGLILSYFSLKRKKIFFLGFFWFFISLAPLSGIIPLNAMYLEHWLYFPIFGFLIIVGGVYNNLSKSMNSKVLIGVGLLFIMFFSIRTILRNNEWANPIKFYKNELTFAPNSTRIHHNLAMEYENVGLLKEAIKEYKISMKLTQFPQTYYNLGRIYFQQKKYKLAETNFLYAIQINPYFKYTYSDLIEMYKQTKSSKLKIVKKMIDKINKKQDFSKEYKMLITQ
jgi:hypothetical protein